MTRSLVDLKSIGIVLVFILFCPYVQAIGENSGITEHEFYASSLVPDENMLLYGFTNIDETELGAKKLFFLLDNSQFTKEWTFSIVVTPKTRNTSTKSIFWNPLDYLFIAIPASEIIDDNSLYLLEIL